MKTILPATELGEEALAEAFGYLDELRESGATNMFGAAAYIQEDLMWDRDEARSALKYWMDTFSLDPVTERVQKALAA